MEPKREQGGAGGRTLTRRALLRGSLAFSALVVGYQLYTRIVVPQLEPPRDARPLLEAVGPSGSHIIDRIAREAFPEGSWEHQATLVMQARNAFLFADRHEVLPNGELRLTPFSVAVMHQGGEITIVQFPSARIEFSEPLEVARLRAGRIVGGQMEGEGVLRHRRDPRDHAQDVVLEGRDFQFSEALARIWSRHEVVFYDSGSFREAMNRGRGSGMEVVLIPDPALRNSRDRPAIGGAESVSLLANVEMDVSLDRGSNFLAEESGQAGGGQAPSAQGTVPAERVPVHITCSGRFQYRLDHDTARFTENVYVWRPNGPEQADRVYCDELELFFARRETEEPESPEQPEGSGPSRQPVRLDFQRLRATGRPVVMTSEKQDMLALADVVTYEAETKTTELSGSDEVVVTHRQSEVRCRSVRLIDDESSEFGRIFAQGPGWLEMRTEENVPQLQAVWRDELRAFPENGRDVLVFTGDSRLVQPGESELAADRIAVWLRATDDLEGTGETPVPLVQGGADGTGETPVPLVQGGQEDAPSRMPELLVAEGSVRLTSEELTSANERLEVWFTAAGAGASGPAEPELDPTIRSIPSPLAADPNRTTSGMLLRPSRSRLVPTALPPRGEEPRAPTFLAQRGLPGMGPEGALAPGGAEEAGDDAPALPLLEGIAPAAPLPDDAPGRARAAAPSGSYVAPEAPGREPLHVESSLLRVFAERRGSETEVREVWTEGDVLVTQGVAEEGGLVLRGEQLHVVGGLNERPVVEVTGQPARVEARGMTLEGPVINLDRFYNMLWIDGPGLLRLPVRSELRLPGTERDQGHGPLDAGALSPSPADGRLRELLINWIEGMRFDGMVADFRGDIVGVLDHSRVHCARMAVTLTDRISFSESRVGEGEQASDVAAVNCYGTVEMQTRTLGERGLTEVGHARAGQISIDNVQGDTFAEGPGEITLVRRGSAEGLLPPELASGPGLAGPDGMAGPGGDGRSGTRSRLAGQSGGGGASEETWRYTHIRFEGRMEGNAHIRETSFFDRVEVTTGPVRSPFDVLDPDRLPPEGAFMQCGQLNVAQHRGTSLQTGEEVQYVTMEAIGNAFVRSDVYQAFAERISYEEDKGLYVLEGLGVNRPASLWRQLVPGGPLEPQYARKILFWPGLNRVRILDASGLDFSAGGR